VIEIPPRRTVNVHASLLPHYRGAAPIQWAIASGETETGVTTMLIDAGLDTGPTLLARALPIEPEETAAELEPRLARLGAVILLETLSGLEAGTLDPVPQDHARASLAPLLHKEDGRVVWTRSACEIVNRLRGFQPWPGASTAYAGAGLKLVRARPAEDASAEPGTILGVDAKGIHVACGHGTSAQLLEIQPESRRSMPAAA